MNDYCQLCNNANGTHTHYCPANPANERSELAATCLPIQFAPVVAADIVIVRVHTESRLAWAVQQFNQLMDLPKPLRLPCWPETIEEAAELADMRGRSDIGADLREALYLEAAQ